MRGEMRFVPRFSALALITLSACGGRSLSTDEAGVDTYHRPRDLRAVPEMSPRPDGPSVVDECGCSPEEVWLLGPCLPTAALGCGQGCDSDDPARGCPAGMRCESDAAAPCCHCSALVAACVPDLPQDSLRDGLRISPTVGVAGQEVQLRIEGHDFIVGPFQYSVRIGGEFVTQDTGPRCTLYVRYTPPAPGIFAVEVSQYGGRGPWVLAGFYGATAGVVPPPAIQPGFACAPEPAPGDAPCASGGNYACECVEGRCACSQR